MTSKIGMLLAGIVFSLQVIAQVPTADYHFDNGDFNDYAGNYHPASTTGVSYSSGERDYATLDGPTGFVTLPATLSAALVAQNSFQISFDIRLTAGQPIAIIGANNGNSSAFWQNAGFSLSALIGTNAVVRFNYGSNSQYASGSITNLSLDEWHQVTLSVNLSTNAWKLQVNDQVEVGAFNFSDADQVLVDRTMNPLELLEHRVGVRVDPGD